MLWSFSVLLCHLFDVGLNPWVDFTVYEGIIAWSSKSFQPQGLCCAGVSTRRWPLSAGSVTASGGVSCLERWRLTVIRFKVSGWWRNEEWRPRQAAVRGDFVSCPSVLVASPVEVSPTPLHHHLLKLHHLPSQRNFVSLLSSSLVYFCFYPLPTSAPRLGKTTHSLSHNSTPSPSQLSQGPERASQTAWWKSFLTAALILTSPSGCFLGYQGSVESKIGSIVSNWAVHWDSSSAAHKEESFEYDFLPPAYPDVFIPNCLSPLLVESTVWNLQWKLFQGLFAVPSGSWAPLSAICRQLTV